MARQVVAEDQHRIGLTDIRDQLAVQHEEETEHLRVKLTVARYIIAALQKKQEKTEKAVHRLVA